MAENTGLIAAVETVLVTLPT